MDSDDFTLDDLIDLEADDAGHRHMIAVLVEGSWGPLHDAIRRLRPTDRERVLLAYRPVVVDAAVGAALRGVAAHLIAHRAVYAEMDVQLTLGLSQEPGMVLLGMDDPEALDAAFHELCAEQYDSERDWSLRSNDIPSHVLYPCRDRAVLILADGRCVTAFREAGDAVDERAAHFAIVRLTIAVRDRDAEADAEYGDLGDTDEPTPETIFTLAVFGMAPDALLSFELLDQWAMADDAIERFHHAAQHLAEAGLLTYDPSAGTIQVSAEDKRELREQQVVVGTHLGFDVKGDLAAQRHLFAFHIGRTAIVAYNQDDDETLAMLRPHLLFCADESLRHGDWDVGLVIYALALVWDSADFATLVRYTGQWLALLEVEPPLPEQRADVAKQLVGTGRVLARRLDRGDTPADEHPSWLDQVRAIFAEAEKLALGAEDQVAQARAHYELALLPDTDDAERTRAFREAARLLGDALRGGNDRARLPLIAVQLDAGWLALRHGAYDEAHAALIEAQDLIDREADATADDEIEDDDLDAQRTLTALALTMMPDVEPGQLDEAWGEVVEMADYLHADRHDALRLLIWYAEVIDAAFHAAGADMSEEILDVAATASGERHGDSHPRTRELRAAASRATGWPDAPGEIPGAHIRSIVQGLLERSPYLSSTEPTPLDVTLIRHMLGRPIGTARAIAAWFDMAGICAPPPAGAVTWEERWAVARPLAVVDESEICARLRSTPPPSPMSLKQWRTSGAGLSEPAAAAVK